MKNKLKQNEIKKEIAIYQSKTGAIEIAIDSKKETLLLTQQQVAQLFGIKKAAISKHVKNIFDSAELEKESTVSILETVQKEGGRKVMGGMKKIINYNYKVREKAHNVFNDSNDPF